MAFWAPNSDAFYCLPTALHAENCVTDVDGCLSAKHGRSRWESATVKASSRAFDYKQPVCQRLAKTTLASYQQAHDIPPHVWKKTTVNKEADGCKRFRPGRVATSQEFVVTPTANANAL